MGKGGARPPIKKPLRMLSAARDELLRFPLQMRRDAAFALRVAEEGAKHPAAKPMKGFGGASVMETVLDDDGSTYRVIYTVRFADVTVLLHAFQKKSKTGIETPRQNIKTIEARLKTAEELFGGKK
jgi:phage-related protein